MIIRPFFSIRRSVLTASQIPRTSISSRVASTMTATTTTTRIARLSNPLTPRQQRLRRPLLFSFAAALGFSIPLLPSMSPTRLDTGTFPTSPFSSSSSSPATYTHSPDPETTTPPTKSSRSIKPAVVRQISLGSILGLGAGVLVGAFSRTLTLLSGVAIVVIQYAARSGYNIIPVNRMQRYVKGINLRAALNDNVAFKISFGLTFALAAFGRF